MPAPKNNSYWKNRSSHGRKAEFETPESFKQAWDDYFKWIDAHPWYKTEQLKKPLVLKDATGKETAETTIKIPTKRPYTEVGFCAFHGLGRHYVTDLDKRLQANRDEDFSNVLSWARGICYADKFEGAAVGAYNASIIARDLGLKEAAIHEVSGKDGSPIKTETEIKGNVDYSALPDEVLLAIVKARKQDEQ